MTTTPTKKPRAAKRRRKTTPKPMTETSYPVTKEEEAKVILPKPEDNLIPLSSYINDFHNRMAINNREIKELGKDIKWVYEKVKPYVYKGIEQGRTLYNRISPKSS